MDVMKRQAVVNAGITFRFRDQRGNSFETTDYLYENGIRDYVAELAGEDTPDGSGVLWKRKSAAATARTNRNTR